LICIFDEFIIKTKQKMATTYDYNETFESRIQDIRLDGPSIYTSILEMTDNSVGWGNADTIKLDFDKSRMILKLADNGPEGFKSIDAIHRFFTLGKKNDLITSKTIGKFGRGGYKATMNIGNAFQLTSIIDGKSYTLSTDFIDMIKNNTQTPTGDIIESDNKKSLVGSTFDIYIRPEYYNSFDTKTFSKHFVRAFHKLSRPVKIIIDGEEHTPSDVNIFNEHMKKREYILLWDKDTNKFYVKLYTEELDEDENSNESNINYYKVGLLTTYTLSKVVTKNDYLGEHPGIDFYRNNRLCNTHNPLRNIGMIGEYLKSGQLRGGRCHMTFEYENIQLTDNLDVDECIGLTTNKEIPEDTSKFNISLLTILEEKAKECSKMYEDLWKSRKDNISREISNIYDQLRTIDKYDDEKLHLDTLDIKKINDNYRNFMENKHWKINEEDEGLTYYFYKDKKEIKQAKENSEDIIQQRANWPSFANVKSIIDLSDKILKRKRDYSEYIKLVDKKKKELKIDFKSAQLVVDLEKFISKKIKEIPRGIDNINVIHSSYEYEKAIKTINDILKMINKSKVKDHFKSILIEYNKNIKHYEALKSDKLKEEELERIKFEESQRLKAENEKKAIEEANAKKAIEEENAKKAIEEENAKKAIEEDNSKKAIEEAEKNDKDVKGDASDKCPEEDDKKKINKTEYDDESDGCKEGQDVINILSQKKIDKYINIMSKMKAEDPNSFQQALKEFIK